MPSCRWLRRWLLRYWLPLLWGLLSRLVVFWSGHTCLSKIALSLHVISHTDQGTEILTHSHDQPKQDSFQKFSSEEDKFHVFLPSVPMPAPWALRVLHIPRWFLEGLSDFLLNNTASFFRGLEKWQEQQELPFPVTLICYHYRDWLKI